MKWYWIVLIIVVSAVVGYGIATMMKPAVKAPTTGAGTGSGTGTGSTGTGNATT